MFFYNDLSDNWKKYTRWVGFSALVGFAFFLFAAAFSYVADAKTKLESRALQSQIAVTGEGKITAKPDVAILNATIMTEKTTVSEAQAKNTESYNKVVAFLDKAGVAKKDIKTTGYSIYPQYFYSNNKKPEIIGYQVRNALEIKIRELSKVDDILGGVVENGANEIGNISFTIENPDALKQAARQLAIEMAKQKAEILSKDLGVRLSRLVGFTENESGGFPPPIFKATTAGAELGYGNGGPDLSQGEQELKVFVTLTYAFKSW